MENRLYFKYCIVSFSYIINQRLANVLRKRCNNGALGSFRKYQRVERKPGKAKLDLTFLTNCIVV